MKVQDDGDEQHSWSNGGFTRLLSVPCEKLTTTDSRNPTTVAILGGTFAKFEWVCKALWF